MCRSYLVRILLCVSWCTVFIINASPAEAVTCVTPFGALGDKAPLSACQPMVDFIYKYGSNLTVAQRKFLDMSFVDFKKRIVCCDLDFELDYVRAFNSVGTEILRNQAFSCGDNTRKRISFGSESTFLAHPWSALLIYRSERKFLCGGTLITDRYVLTAAHCVKLHPYAVRLGEHDINVNVDCQLDEMGQEHCLSPPIDVRIENAIVHPDYSTTTYANDIALLRLDTQITFINSIKVICIPEYQNQLFGKEYGVISGWGATEHSLFSNVNREATIPIISQDSCQSVYRRRSIDNTRLCTRGVEGEDTCDGDSGGPLYVRVEGHEDGSQRKFRYMQIGVISMGFFQCGTKMSFPALYTNIAAFRDWIASSLEL